MPPPTVGLARRLDRVDELASLARAWRNCLGDYRSAIDAGSCAVYLWQDAEKPAACLVCRHGRLGWFLDEVKDPRNADIAPEQRAIIDSASRPPVSTENPIPKEMDHREIAVRVPMMNEVQLLFSSEPCKPLQSRSLYVVFLVEEDVRVERCRTCEYLNHEEIDWQ
jgi:hypothetical protein